MRLVLGESAPQPLSGYIYSKDQGHYRLPGLQAGRGVLLRRLSCVQDDVERGKPTCCDVHAAYGKAGFAAGCRVAFLSCSR